MWGTALADHTARLGARVTLWEFAPEAARKFQATRRHPFIAGFKLHANVRVVSELGEAVKDAAYVLVVLPSMHVRKTARALAALLDKRRPRPVIVNAAKGVEPSSLRTMGEVLLEEMPFQAGRMYTLSGPSFAREVIRGVPTKLVLAGEAGPLAAQTARVFDGGAIRIEHSTDRIGAELGGSLKNVLAIGCGIAEGLGAAANTQAALMTQGIGEMGLLIEALGGRRETIYGLSGLGDLIVTGSSSESRNRTCGQKLGKGKGLKKALSEIPTVVEGVESAHSAHTLVKTTKIKAPLLEAIWRVVHKDARPELIITALGFGKR